LRHSEELEEKAEGRRQMAEVKETKGVGQRADGRRKERSFKFC
jgi:hypothetical protein